MARAKEIKTALEEKLAKLSKAQESIEGKLKSAAGDFTTSAMALEKLLEKEIAPNISAKLKAIEKELTAYKKSVKKEMGKLRKAYARELAELRKAREQVTDTAPEPIEEPATSKSRTGTKAIPAVKPTAQKATAKKASAPKRTKPAAKKPLKAGAKAEAAKKKPTTRKRTAKPASKSGAKTKAWQAKTKKTANRAARPVPPSLHSPTRASRSEASPS